ncbi:hypothetical protein [Jiangella gansuensis]|uniref:hypothetical protein n=1 Tax=Jiangella gansuensis TaxID=281473 RepID=UPI0004B2C612|nr:hypothetical protein [Jiangella gansuensis]
MTMTWGERTVMFVLVVLVLLAGLAIGFAATQHGEARLVHDLRAHGRETLASDAEMRPAAGRSETLRVRAEVELPSGPRVLELRAVSPSGWSLPPGRWSPAPAPYEGEFPVRFDPADPERVMAESDLDGYEGLDGRVLWTVAGVLTALAAIWVWPAVRVIRAWSRRGTPAGPSR